MSTRGVTPVLEGHGRTAAVGLTSLPEFRGPRPLNAPRQACASAAWVCWCPARNPVSGSGALGGVRLPSRFTVVDRTSNKELVNAAQGVLNPHTVGGRLFGQVDPANLDTEVILGHDRSALVRELLPAHDWPRPLASA